MARIIKAIQLINPNADCSVEDDDIDKIRWYDGNPKNITKSQIKSKLPEVDSQIIIEEKRTKKKCLPFNRRSIRYAMAFNRSES